jgi:nucleoside-diphosphate-sugar epimerase
VIIVGCGFLGEAAAALFLEAGWEVLGIVGSAEGVARLACAGHEVVQADISRPCAFGRAWEAAELLVHSASTRGGGVDAYRRVYAQGLARVVEAVKPSRTVFVSSTSVYGQTDGAWVDEGSDASPQSATSQVLREVEEGVLGSGGVVLRLAGLYGPGRSVLLRRFLTGQAVVEGGGLRWINQIHRDDAARAVRSAADLAAGIYNVCDNHPTTQREVYEWMAELTGRPMPEARDSVVLRRRGASNKRVSNARLKSTGWAPLYPSYRQALPSLLPAEGISPCKAT